MNPGHHFIVGLQSTKLSSEEKSLLKELQPSGIILFRYNFSTSADWLDQLSDLLAEVETLIEAPNPIISIDHEGGKVQRLGAPITHFPPAISWQESASSVGEIMGNELRALGINLNFAPVLDVNTFSANPIIGHRALSSDPLIAGQYGLEFLNAMQRAGVFGCIKHFPGHGRSREDSHLCLPSVDCSEEELAATELPPFEKAISSGEIEMIMTAHVVYPALDPDNPATLSSIVLQDKLRGKLGYQGLIVSDALEMKALDGISDGKLANTAIEAGVDLLLVAQPENRLPLKRALELRDSLDTNNEKQTEIRLSAFRSKLGNLSPKTKEEFSTPKAQELNQLLEDRYNEIQLLDSE